MTKIESLKSRLYCVALLLTQFFLNSCGNDCTNIENQVSDCNHKYWDYYPPESERGTLPKNLRSCFRFSSNHDCKYYYYDDNYKYRSLVKAHGEYSIKDDTFSLNGVACIIKKIDMDTIILKDGVDFFKLVKSANQSDTISYTHPTIVRSID
jgi:hypothetical protein